MKKNIMKRVVAMMVLTCTLIGLLFQYPITGFAATIAETSKVKGSDFTDRPLLAAALDAIFQGDASIYTNQKCTHRLNTTLGSRNVPNNGVNLYVGAYGKGAKNTGTSCWIYANGVYFTLFGDALGNGTPGKNSVKLSLSGTSSKSLTYDNLCKWGVSDEVGAQIRIGGHSIIVLDYNENFLTYLDGNGDGRGLIAVRKSTWSQVRSTSCISGQVKYIIQPKAEYLSKVYPRYTELCKVYPTGVGTTVQVTKKTTIKTLPCSRKTSADSTDIYTAQVGDRYTVLSLIENTAGNYWYALIVKSTDGSTQIGYMFAGDAQADRSYIWKNSTLYDSINGYSLIVIR